MRCVSRSTWRSRFERRSGGVIEQASIRATWLAADRRPFGTKPFRIKYSRMLHGRERFFEKVRLGEIKGNLSGAICVKEGVY